MKPQQSHHTLWVQVMVLFYTYNDLSISIKKKYIKEKTQKYCFLINNI